MPLTKRQILELEAVDSIYEYEEDPIKGNGKTDDEPTLSMQSKPKVYISNVDRTRIIKAHLNGQKPKIISEIMDVPQRRVEVIIRHYAKTGRICSANSVPSSSSPNPSPNVVTNPVAVDPCPAAKPKLTAQQIEHLRGWANEDATQTGAQLTKRMNDMFDTNVSVNTIQRHLDPFFFSLNRPSCPEVKNDPSTLALRKEFCQILHDLPTMYEDPEVIFVGHVRFRMAIRNRVEKSRGRLRQRNLSICIAMTRQQVIGYLAQHSPVEAAEFQAFVLSVISGQVESRGITSGVLIMDESCAKEGSDVLSAAVLVRDHTIIFLPPFSPFLNPLESVFNEFRDLFGAAKLEPSNESMLVDCLIEGTSLTEAIDCPRHLELAMGYVPRCLESEPIEIANLYSIFAAEACEGEEDHITDTVLEEMLSDEVVILES